MLENIAYILMILLYSCNSYVIIIKKKVCNYSVAKDWGRILNCLAKNR